MLTRERRNDPTSMIFPRARLVVSACLFVGWIGFLLYLVLQNQKMIVLSRPQLLVAPLCVIADVGDVRGQPAPQVTIERVVWAQGPAPHPLEKIEVRFGADVGAKEGYAGAGKYILPLTPLLGASGPVYGLVPIPYPVSDFRIYPVTRETEHQLEEIERLRQ
jgi:hypothetical protein